MPRPIDLLTLPVWDAAAYFLAPSFSQISVTLGPTSTVVAKANPQRWGLVLATAGSIGVVCAPNAPQIGNTGIQLSNNLGPLVATYPLWGPCVTAAWYVNSGTAGSATIAVIEMILDGDWPNDASAPAVDILHQAARVAPEKLPPLPPAPDMAGNPSIMGYWQSVLSRMTKGR